MWWVDKPLRMRNPRARGQRNPIVNNFTCSPLKRWKNKSSAIQCATGAWGLKFNKTFRTTFFDEINKFIPAPFIDLESSGPFLFPRYEVVLANGAMIFLLFDVAGENFYWFSFDGHYWNETDVYIQNDISNIITKIKKSRGPYNDRYSQTIAVKNSKKERLEVFLIFPKAFFFT